MWEIVHWASANLLLVDLLLFESRELLGRRAQYGIGRADIRLVGLAV